MFENKCRPEVILRRASETEFRREVICDIRGATDRYRLLDIGLEEYFKRMTIAHDTLVLE